MRMAPPCIGPLYIAGLFVLLCHGACHPPENIQRRRALLGAQYVCPRGQGECVAPARAGDRRELRACLKETEVAEFEQPPDCRVEPPPLRMVRPPVALVLPNLKLVRGRGLGSQGEGWG